mmetsp:Transcript_5378/g.13513  ORF Transcript_5378/g.13513 Transcript_5378/m.13513 type:complete len:206 (+) Transcript_5378:183-800(+)
MFPIYSFDCWFRFFGKNSLAFEIPTSFPSSRAAFAFAMLFSFFSSRRAFAFAILSSFFSSRSAFAFARLSSFFSSKAAFAFAMPSSFFSSMAALALAILLAFFSSILVANTFRRSLQSPALNFCTLAAALSISSRTSKKSRSSSLTTGSLLNSDSSILSAPNLRSFSSNSIHNCSTALVLDNTSFTIQTRSSAFENEIRRKSSKS